MRRGELWPRTTELVKDSQVPVSLSCFSSSCWSEAPLGGTRVYVCRAVAQWTESLCLLGETGKRILNELIHVCMGTVACSRGALRGSPAVMRHVVRDARSCVRSLLPVWFCVRVWCDGCAGTRAADPGKEQGAGLGPTPDKV